MAERAATGDDSGRRMPRVTRTTGLWAAAGAALAIAALALAGCAPGAAEPGGAPTPTDVGDALPSGVQDELRAVLDETMAEYDVPGAVAGVWVPGAGSWTTAAGVADIETGEPTSTAMSWPLRSITKSYTVTLLLQLVDEGQVDLDDTIDQYVDGVTDGDAITLRQLAGMSSGNADYTNEEFFADFTADPERIFTLDELLGYMLGKPAQFAPGAEHVYTNANTNLLGAVVEEVTGRPFAEVLDERILGPLGLDGTSYTVDVTQWPEPHAAGYGPASEDPREPMTQNLSIFGPAGSMISTLEDGRTWADALGSGALLEPATQEERRRGAPLDAGPPYDRYALGIGETDGWWGHNGEGLGFTAALFHQPETAATIVVFMNASNLVDRTHPADLAFRRMAAVLEDAVPG